MVTPIAKGVGPVRYKTNSVQRADDFGTGPLRYIDKHMPWTSPLRYIFQYDFGTYDLDLHPPDISQSFLLFELISV